jgi:hypothetical protein
VVFPFNLFIWFFTSSTNHNEIIDYVVLLLSIAIYIYIYIYIPIYTKWGRKQRMGDLEVGCGGSNVYRVMVSIKEDSNVHNNLHIKI